MCLGPDCIVDRRCHCEKETSGSRALNETPVTSPFPRVVYFQRGRLPLSSVTILSDL